MLERLQTVAVIGGLIGIMWRAWEALAYIVIFVMLLWSKDPFWVQARKEKRKIPLFENVAWLLVAIGFTYVVWR